MWKVSQCAVQGRGHQQKNIPCQDKTFSLFKNGVQIIALADGAGTASHAEYGAEAVVEEVCELLSEQFQFFYDTDDAESVQKGIIGFLLDKLSSRAAELGCEIKDLASTVLFAAIKENQYILGHLGDGVIGYWKGTEIGVASEPDNGEYANMTVFVTSPSATDDLRLSKGNIGELCGFVLMSDGAESSFFHKKKKLLAPAIGKFFRVLAVLPETEVQRNVHRSMEEMVKLNTMDDCSLVLFAKEQSIADFIDALPETEQKIFFHLNPLRLSDRRKFKRIEHVISLCKKPQTCLEISKKIHLRKKYTHNFLTYICSLELLIYQNGMYIRN